MKRILITLLPFLFMLLIPACGGPSQTTVTFEDGTNVRCEIADSVDRQRAGLTTHETLEENQGMIFVYPKEKDFTSFWMPAAMNFRIDIIFVSADKRINTIHRNVPICESNNELDCPSYISERPTRYVVEVVAGFCDKRGIKVGDSIEFEVP